MSTIQLTYQQAGYTDVSPAWVDVGIQAIALSANGLAAIRWNVSEKGVLADSLTLQTTGFSGTDSGTFTIYTVRERSCAAFSTARLPVNRKLEVALTGSASFAPAGVQQFVIPLNTTTGTATWARNALGFGVDPNSFGLAFGWTGADLVLLAQLTLGYSPAFTGLSGPYMAMGRADECPKCGRKSTRDTWVRDRFLDRMTCPECYDPHSFEDVDARRGANVGTEREGLGEG